MNRRTLLATTPLALVPRLPGRTPSDTEEPVSDPPSLKDLLPDADRLPTDWVLGAPESPAVGRRDDDDRPLTVWGLKSRRHPQTDESLSPRFAERRFVTDSDLPPEFEHLDVALEVASVGEHADHDSRSRAIRALHKVTVAEETENWELLSTGWVDVDVTPADDRLFERSVASIRKPQCAVPNDVELSTDKPVLEMAVAVVPLSWGTVVVTGTLVDPDDTDQMRQLVSRLASRTVDTVRRYPLPVEVSQ